jgi:arylsulfatase A-like enzyme
MVIVLVADGARPDTLARAMDDGVLPALARLRDEGALHTVTSTFPSVTGPAYTAFLMGRYPGPVGLPGLRWYDRKRTVVRHRGHSRSYVGIDLRHVDEDIDPTVPTIFELVGRSVAALNVIGRGLNKDGTVGRGLGFVIRAAQTHFTGNVQGWLRIDRKVATAVLRRVRDVNPRFVFAAFTGIDKTSHAAGHDAPVVRDAMRIVDDAAAELRADAERAGQWDRTHLWVVSDHGHSAVQQHDDLAALLRGLGHRITAHPWTFFGGRDAAVMVSGNAMAHIYLELDRLTRPWWPAVADRWSPLADALLARESVDLMLLPHSPTQCEVRSRERGTAMVERHGDLFRYQLITGDPLGIGTYDALSPDAAYHVTAQTDYPDSIVQIAHLAGAARSGEIILSARRDWDFRGTYEPIHHRSSHGALHREHMLVPLLVNRPVAREPRRTVDVMPAALRALRVALPTRLDGASFL